jgi:hypothetical protein
MTDFNLNPKPIETDPERKRAQASLIAVAGNRSEYSQRAGIAAILAHKGLIDRERPMKRFAILGGANYYSRGGFNDLVGSADTQERAIEIGVELTEEYKENYDAFHWWHVVDLYTGEIVHEVGGTYGSGSNSNYGLQKVSKGGVLSPVGEPDDLSAPDPVEFRFRVEGQWKVEFAVIRSYRAEAQEEAEKHFGKLPKGEWKPVKGEERSYFWDSFAFAYDQ